MSKKVVIINGYRTRKEVAEILDINERTLYELLKSDYFKDKIPARARLSPAHQRLIFDYCGIEYK
ncbi:MAG TPA: hypothetical protein PKC76_08100 [Saprospiraceae bacterium]|nr:hypothetical protein [Saprospiraceae bacterium]HMP24077.1 hypothetical protein [Saprospiraceae bacterium]